MPSLNYGWIPANSLKSGMHLKTPDGQSAVVVGGSVPAVHDGWMWDLTVPGDNDHDFYVTVAETAGLVHNCGPSEASLDNEAEAHIRARHFPGGAEVDSSSGIFNADESIDDLVDLANTQEASPNEYGLYERVVNAGRVIGRTSELQGNLPTTTYRLWQDYYGGIMSMHPIPG
jgi:hypothetical protein